MSRNRTMPGGFASPSDLECGENGRALCRWCSLEVPAGRRTFCSDFCVHEWKLRTDPGYLRDKVLQRDRGICAVCGMDCVAEWNRIRRSPVALKKWGLSRRARKSLWDADHIVPVAEGGGECDLENLRTLCLVCHRKATADLRIRLQSAARAAAGQ